MPLSSYVTRGAAAVSLGLAAATLAAVMLFIYKGNIANLNPIGMIEHPLQSDFALYYRDSSVAVKAPKHNPYDLRTFQQVTAAIGIRRLTADPVVPSLSLPPLIWVVVPFTHLPFELAYLLWMA